MKRQEQIGKMIKATHNKGFVQLWLDGKKQEQQNTIKQKFPA